MYIKTLKIENFKSFISEEVEFKNPTGTPGSGLNILVGENNCGKSNLFESIDFLRNGTKKNLDQIKNNYTGEDFFVEATFSGNIEEVVKKTFADSASQTKFLKAVYLDRDGNQTLRLRRQSLFEEITQGSSIKKIDHKTLLVFNPTEKAFHNITGLPGLVQKLFEVNFLWTDTNPGDETKYSSTSLSGKLLAEITKSFKSDNKLLCEEFLKTFRKTFNNPSSGLQKEFNDISKLAQQVVKDQFKEVGMSFQIEEPEFEDFFKKMKIEIEEGGTKTLLSDKGTGLQRAIVLSLIQVYADKIREGVERPFFLFIDEPETGYHPQAQRKLLNALLRISGKQQIFISTHSPYFIPPTLIQNIIRVILTTNGTKTLGVKGDYELTEKERDIYSIDIREIFFAKNILCVEGKTDVSHLSRFLDITNCTIVKMSGCGETSKYWKAFNAFSFSYKIVLDLDVLNKNGAVFKNINRTMHDNIQSLGIETTKKNATPLKNISLSKEQIKAKNALLKTAKGHDIYILPEGMIEDYFNDDGTTISRERETELNDLFKK